MSREVTSTHAEYSGLLLGLEYLDSLNPEELPMVLGDNRTDSRGERSLIIRGDCKAVIDQLRGQSAPRKVESLHRAANNLLSHLAHKFARLEMMHIPREQNGLCDSLCSNLIDTIAWRQAESLAMDLNSLQDTVPSANHATGQKSLHEEASIEHHQGKLVGTPGELFSRYFEPETRCCIPYSLRPDYYQAIATLSLCAGAFETLVTIGERQAAESLLQKNKPMLAKGVQNQIAGWRGKRNEKKAAQLERRHRFLLSKHGKYQTLEAVHRPFMVRMRAPRIAHDGIHDSWYPMLHQFHQSAMEQDWKEGCKLWIPSDGAPSPT